MKVTLIGPDPLFKGGIAHYNHHLANAIVKDGNKLQFIGFKKQYPAFLYPPDSGDHSNEKFENRCYDIERIFTYYNPISFIKAALKIRRFVPDIVIIPWWTYFWFIHFFILLKSLPKTQIKVIAHNALPHEKGGVKRLFINFINRQIFKNATSIFVQSKKERAIVEKYIKKVTVLYHPVYPHLIPQITKSEARKALGFKKRDKIALCFGTIRKYKGSDLFAKAVSEAHDIKGVIAGEVWDKSIGSEIKKAAESNSNITFIDNYLSNRELKKLMAASDVIVLPYRSVTGSGVAMAAIAAKKPVIVSDLELFLDICDPKSRTVFKRGDVQSLKDAIISFFSDNNLNLYQKFDTIPDRFSWEHAIRILLYK